MSHCEGAPRRAFLRRTVLAGLGISLVACVGPRRAAAQPPTATGADGFRVLRARPASAPGGRGDPSAALWGYDGITPGPLLRVSQGDELRVRLLNELPEPTAIHWHGLRLPNIMDGVPHLTQPPVAPGASFDYRFAPPDAGTFWYHPALASQEPAASGLYGILIVDEATAVDVDRDVAVVIDDSSFPASFVRGSDGQPGRAGGGGPFAPFPLQIPLRANERLRLRLLNAAGTRFCVLRVDQHQPIVMAMDGQPAEPYAPRDGRIVLGPGNRIDLFVDATLGPGAVAALMLDAGQGERAFARLVYASDSPARPTPRDPPTMLPANPLPERMDFARALKLDLPLDDTAKRASMGGAARGAARGSAPGAERSIWSPLGTPAAGFDASALFTVARGRTVMLAFSNRARSLCAMHLHGHHFRLLDSLDDGWKPFWLDTLVILPGQTARIAFVADNPGRWMVGYRKLDDPGSAMAACFQVT